MILRSCLSAALLGGAAAALAQSEPPAAAPPAPTMTAQQTAVQTTAMAMGQCVMAGVQGVPATVTPEAGAVAVLAGCATQRQQLEQAVEAMIATMPEEQKAGAREQFSTQMAGAETQIAAAIGRQRAAAPATPAQ